MSGENHEGNKSPDIYDGNNQRRFLCSRAMKHEAMTAYETQGSSCLEGSNEGRTPKCPRVDKAVTGSNIEKRKGHMTVHWWIGLLLGATFKRRKDTEMSIGRKGCHWEQHSKEEMTLKCPLSDRAVVGSNVQKRKGH
jgi:hypothetical protein